MSIEDGDELAAGNVEKSSSGEEFSVEQLLDFSNGCNFVEEEDQEVKAKAFRPHEDELENQNPTGDKQNNGRISEFFGNDRLDSVLAGELYLPEDDMENLEWLSNFVDDSNMQYSLLFPAGKMPEKTMKENVKEAATSRTRKCFSAPVPAKSRTKRARMGGRIWSFGPSSANEASCNSAPSASSSCTSPLTLSHWFGSPNPIFDPAEPILDRPNEPRNRLRKPLSRVNDAKDGGVLLLQPRRCSHCGVQKTPQWRAGPLGSKTLCNACGVRFKSGRLFPEYRPACSPTFSSILHSNHHRKVLEMRKKKAESGLID